MKITCRRTLSPLRVKTVVAMPYFLSSCQRIAHVARMGSTSDRSGMARQGKTRFAAQGHDLSKLAFARRGVPAERKLC